ncbi:LytR C-terminal domain-containing protein [Nocardioides sp. Kera G14]|uniref:LytR C-terminal domain-containing protein n=1 Tax=Nocardioides sp. Kera G14 TaxID=2884264 RepID=UPI001D0F5877|nr:LytR C-terminal domain-containing protein [Nocardioides sp. Kera G14]UDY23699.1 LytR C-terminal domain-containing protein [Nocardioides sp. Kera G14]
MNPFLRTALTIGGLLVVLLLAAAWGWGQVMKPLPSVVTETAVCTETPVKAGDSVTPDEVTVSVLNAGRRAGLASRTMQQFTDQGFNKGQSANAPAKSGVSNVQIWTDDPASPAVKLVASRLPDAKVVEKSVSQVGVVVVVGDRFKEPETGESSVKASKDTTICSP